MPGSSVSSRMAKKHQTLMICCADALKNCMKSALKLCTSDIVLVQIAEDYKNFKRIVENSKRFEWNTSLPDGYQLVEEIETRFGKIFMLLNDFSS